MCSETDFIMRKISFFLLLLSIFNQSWGKNLPYTTKIQVENFLTQKARETVFVPDIHIDSTVQDENFYRLYVNVNLSYISFNNQKVNYIYKKISTLIPDLKPGQKLQVITDTKPIEFFVVKNRETSDLFANPKTVPIVENLSSPSTATAGLYGSHLVLWPSHGFYYVQSEQKWDFQRVRLFQSIEDLLTPSFVLTYLTPMLENAGSYVFLPRERDTQKNEIIVDNDGSTGNSTYTETNAGQVWKTAIDTGFANPKKFYVDHENPFKMGTYREITSTQENDESLCEWTPEIPEKGKYSVYVSYKSLTNSAKDARYTVYHLGGATKFSVNQQMGGSTWIFLGFFDFDKGKNNTCKVVLSNYSRDRGTVITADAVKIGGGMGNIARCPLPKPVDSISNNTIIQPIIAAKLTTSQVPKFVEGARYWLQWAGAPDSVYSRTKGQNDYLDDFQSRGYWVNYLAGGSSVAPDEPGAHVPIDMALALHTDAGTVAGDSIIGTLGISMEQFNHQKFENGKTRWTSRDLTDVVMGQIISDIRASYEPDWTRRPMWDRSYSEARVPNVPTMLLELLSHQNFADMRYALDPNFRFVASRAIYKGILKFLAQQHQRSYVVQPLPVKDFYAKFISNNRVQLGWQPTFDKSDNSAKPTQYVLYTRENGGGFDNGRLISKNVTQLTIEPDKIYSYKVVAINAGGSSFPSEILSVCKKIKSKGTVLIINAFDRLSAPDSFASDSLAGFADSIDHGVPYIQQINYIGSQAGFNVNAKYVNNDTLGFGSSNSNFAGKIIAGNSFDYPFIHGKSIAHAGYSFVSSSRDAITNGTMSMIGFPLVDIILGKQKKTKSGRGAFAPRYKTFDKVFQAKITTYCEQGGNLLISGAYVASDLWKSQSDRNFATNTLKIKLAASRAAHAGKVTCRFPREISETSLNFDQELNDSILAIESPDAISPADHRCIPIMQYAENGLNAATLYQGKYNSCIIGFPIESIPEAESRDNLFKILLNVLNK